jgi:hypothetical protein
MIIKKLYLCILLIILLCVIYFINKTEELTDLNGNEYNTTNIKYTQEVNTITTPILNAPKGQLNSIAVDKYGNIYVSSLNDNNIYMYVSTPNYLNSNPANSYFGLKLSKGDIRSLPIIFDQPTNQYDLKFVPTSLAIDNDGNLYCSVCLSSIGYDSGSAIYMLCNTTNKAYNIISDVIQPQAKLNYIPPAENKNKLYLAGNNFGITSIAVDNYSNVFFLCNAGSANAGVYVLINDSSKCVFKSQYPTSGQVYLIKLLNPITIISIKLSYDGNTLFVLNGNSFIRIINLAGVSTDKDPTASFGTSFKISAAVPSVTPSIYSSILNDVIYRDYDNNLYKVSRDNNYKNPASPMTITYNGSTGKQLSSITGISTFTNFTIDNNNNIYIINSAIPSDNKASSIYKIDNLTGIINKFFNCPINQFINNDYTGCVATCPTTSFILYDGSACINSCTPSQLKGPSGNVCVPNLAGLCPPGLFLATNNDQCVTQCDTNQIISSDYTKCINVNTKIATPDKFPNSSLRGIAVDNNDYLFVATLSNSIPYVSKIYAIKQNANPIEVLFSSGGYTPPSGYIISSIAIDNSTNKIYILYNDVYNNTPGILCYATINYQLSTTISFGTIVQITLSSPNNLILNKLKIYKNNLIYYDMTAKSFIYLNLTTYTEQSKLPIPDVATIGSTLAIKITSNPSVDGFCIDDFGNLFTCIQIGVGINNLLVYGFYVYASIPGKFLGIPITNNDINKFQKIMEKNIGILSYGTYEIDNNNNLYYNFNNILYKIDNNGVESTLDNTTIELKITKIILYNQNLYYTDARNNIYIYALPRLITSCPSGYLLSVDSKTCLKECPANQFVTADLKRCVASCPI